MANIEFLKLTLMNQIEHFYLNLIEPQNLIEHIQDFEAWCASGDKESLKAALAAFEVAELFEHCAIIQRYIKNF